MRFERLVYTRHARERMAERNITEEDVLRILNDPHLTYPSYGKNVAEQIFPPTRELRVVWVPDPAPETDARIISTVDLEEPR